MSRRQRKDKSFSTQEAVPHLATTIQDDEWLGSQSESQVGSGWENISPGTLERLRKDKKLRDLAIVYKKKEDRKTVHGSPPCLRDLRNRDARGGRKRQRRRPCGVKASVEGHDRLKSLEEKLLSEPTTAEEVPGTLEVPVIVDEDCGGVNEGQDVQDESARASSDEAQNGSTELFGDTQYLSPTGRTPQPKEPAVPRAATTVVKTSTPCTHRSVSRLQGNGSTEDLWEESFNDDSLVRCTQQVEASAPVAKTTGRLSLSPVTQKDVRPNETQSGPRTSTQASPGGVVRPLTSSHHPVRPSGPAAAGSTRPQAPPGVVTRQSVQQQRWSGPRPGAPHDVRAARPPHAQPMPPPPAVPRPASVRPPAPPPQPGRPARPGITSIVTHPRPARLPVQSYTHTGRNTSAYSGRAPRQAATPERARPPPDVGFSPNSSLPDEVLSQVVDREERKLRSLAEIERNRREALQRRNNASSSRPAAPAASASRPATTPAPPNQPVVTSRPVTSEEIERKKLEALKRRQASTARSGAVPASTPLTRPAVTSPTSPARVLAPNSPGSSGSPDSPRCSPQDIEKKRQEALRRRRDRRNSTPPGGPMGKRLLFQPSPEKADSGKHHLSPDSVPAGQPAAKRSSPGVGVYNKEEIERKRLEAKNRRLLKTKAKSFSNSPSSSQPRSESSPPTVRNISPANIPSMPPRVTSQAQRVTSQTPVAAQPPRPQSGSTVIKNLSRGGLSSVTSQTAADASSSPQGQSASLGRSESGSRLPCTQEEIRRKRALAVERRQALEQQRNKLQPRK